VERKKKVVVTGGAGFIGSHLAELLVQRGYEVIIIDDLSSGKMANIENLIKKNKVQFFNGSVTDLSLLQTIFRGAQSVFHLAAVVSVSRSIGSPLNSHEVNLTGTLNVLVAARDNGLKKVVFSSSAAVYGDNPVLPHTEIMVPNPLSPYGVTKLAAEYYCRVFQQVYGLPTVCLRYFNVYGPRQDPNSEYAAVIPKFIQRASEEKPIIIYGDGEQT
jgi:UDP-glucose 4-epimerase